MRPALTLLLLALAVLAEAAHAQAVVQGRVTDAETGEGLPAATVRVEWTTRGTVTNREGDYELALPADAPPVVLVQFLGFETARRAVPDGGRLDVALRPALGSLGEAVVTAEASAEAVMRRVIRRKARWRAGLQTWRADVYSRQTLRGAGAIVAVVEGQTVAYWDRGRGLREVVRGARTTGNLDDLPLDSFSAADRTLNLYDDDVEFGGYDLMGPSHPRALSFYAFTLEGRRALGPDLVYDLSFRPKNPLQPGFVGTLSVLAGADAIVSVRVRPNNAVQFPLVTQFELAIEQQFSSFGQEVGGEPIWLPVDYRLDLGGRAGNALLAFPGLGVTISSRLTDYETNVAVPDSLFEVDRVRVDPEAVAGVLPEAGVVPLSDEEARALAEIDSTQTVVEAFQPTGLLARFIDVNVRVNSGDDEDAAGSGGGDGRRQRGGRARTVGLDLGPIAAYDRVAGARLGGEVSSRIGPAEVEVRAGYETGPGSVVGGAEASVPLGGGVRVGAWGERWTVPLAESFYVGPVVNSVAALAFGEDYFDYARRTGGGAWVEGRSRRGWRPSVRLDASLAEYHPLVARTEFSLLGSLPAANTPADGGTLARVGLEAGLGDTDGSIETALGSRRSLVARVEGGHLDGPAPTNPYLRLEGDARWSVATALRRRLLPPTLHLRLAAGTATGGLPVQRSFGIDGRLGAVAPFGALRARSGRLALAQRYALVAWEHDFRSVPFELLGWAGAAPRGLSVQVHGAHAWADGAPAAVHVEPSVVHHEVGLSLGLGYSLPLRLDATVRLTDSPELVLGFGLARLF